MQGCTSERALRSDCQGCVEGDMSRSERGPPVPTKQGALPVCSCAVCRWQLASFPGPGPGQKQGELEHVCALLCSWAAPHFECVLASLYASSVTSSRQAVKPIAVPVPQLKLGKAVLLPPCTAGPPQLVTDGDSE